MLGELFALYLRLSADLRVDYPGSLGVSASEWEDVVSPSGAHIPRILVTAYNQVSGTKGAIEDQSLMDFIPGYRLIHIAEYRDHDRALREVLRGFHLKPRGSVFPILTNYSSDYVYVQCDERRNAEQIGCILHDAGELVTMHETPEDFLKTLCAFYENGVYHLDEDAYLDYNFEKQEEIGTRINPGIHYWTDS